MSCLMTVSQLLVSRTFSSGPSQVRMAQFMHHCYSPDKATVGVLLLVAVPVPSDAVHLQSSW